MKTARRMFVSRAHLPTHHPNRLAAECAVPTRHCPPPGGFFNNTLTPPAPSQCLAGCAIMSRRQPPDIPNCHRTSVVSRPPPSECKEQLSVALSGGSRIRVFLAPFGERWRRRRPWQWIGPHTDPSKAADRSSGYKSSRADGIELHLALSAGNGGYVSRSGRREGWLICWNHCQ